MPVYTNSNSLKYTVISFYEEMDVVFRLKGAGGGGGGHPDDVLKDYRGGNGSEGGFATGTVRVRPGEMWEVYLGAGGKRGLSWFLGGEGGPGGSARSGFHGGPGGRQGSLGRSSGGGGGGGASTIHMTGSLAVVANGGAGGGGEGLLGSGRDAGTAHTSTTNSNFGGQGATSASDDGGGGGGGGGGLPGGLGGAFGAGDTGGRAGVSGQSYTSIPGVIVQQTGGSSGGIGGSGDITNNTDGADGFFEIVDLILPPNRYTGIYTKNAGTWKQPVPNVKHNGTWKQIQEGYVKHNGNWKRVYPPKISVEINDYNVLEGSSGSAVAWNNTVATLPQPEVPATPFYALTASATPVAEGAAFTITFTTNQSGSFPYTITGVNSADINGATLTGTFTGSGQSRTYTVTADAITEGQEVFTMRLDNGQASTSVVLIDSSTAPETYSLTPNVVSVNEGNSFTVTFTTNQTGSFGYTISGVSSADIGGASLSGTFSGSGDSRTFTVTSDVTSEGPEIFSIRLNNNLAVTNVTINDSSMADDNPTKFAFTSRFDQPLSTTIESDTVTITGINVPVPVTVTAGQFRIAGGAWTTSGNITDGQPLQLRLTTSSNYNVTQGVDVRVGSGVATWTVATRSAPVPTYRITPDTLNVREGDRVTFHIGTTDVPNGTVLYWRDSGNTGPQDFTDGLTSGTVTIQNNSATLIRPVKADAGVASPAEYILISLALTSGGTALVTAPRVDITDTSITVIDYPTRGTLLSTYCQSTDKWGNYADGTGGSYQQIIQANSADCGWKDETPNGVTFVNRALLKPSQAETSNTVTISGLSVSVPVTLDTGLSASKNGGAFQTSGLSVTNGDTLQLRATTASGYNRTNTYSISIGKFSTTWSITTENGPSPVVSNTNWNGVFNSDNARLTFNLGANATNGPIISARIVSQPSKGTVTIGEDGRTAFYTPNANSVRPGTISAGQAQTYVNYWTDLFPNGIKSTLLAQQHWINQGLSENRYIPTIFSGSDSFTFAVTNQYGESNIASVLMQFTAPSNLPLDDVAPVVTSTMPGSGATGLSLSTDISITYSEAVYPGTGTITMVDQYGTPSGSWTNANVTISGPIVSLSSGAKKSSTSYTVSVPAGFVKDIAGNPSSAHSWTFTTADAETPYVIGVDVVRGHVTLIWNENITVTSNAGVEVIGPYYANRAIESLSCGLQQSGSNRTEIIGWTNRFNDTAYRGMVEYGSVRDAAGNLNDNQNVGWVGDENYYPPDPPLDPPPGGGTGGISGGTDITIDSGMYIYNQDSLYFSVLDLLRGNTTPFVDIPIIDVTSINIKSVSTDLNILGGTINSDIVNGSALLQIPNIYNLDASSTPTTLVGTVDTSSFSTISLGLDPKLGSGASLNVDWQQAAGSEITAIPLTLQTDVTFSNGITTSAGISLTVTSTDGSYTGSYYPDRSFGDNRLSDSGFDFSSD